MLDVMTGGRFIAGFPWALNGHQLAYGQVPATLREKYREGTHTHCAVLDSPEAFSFNGKYTQLRYVNIWPYLPETAPADMVPAAAA